MNDIPGPVERRRAFKAFAGGNGTPQDREVLEALARDDDTIAYGRAETVMRVDRPEGEERYPGNFKGELVNYLAEAKVTGLGIDVQSAHRIDSESEHCLTIRRVESPLEIDAVKLAIKEQLRRDLGK